MGGLGRTGWTKCRTLGGGRPRGDLVHVDIGRIEESTFLGHGDHGECIGQPLGGDRRTLQRVERDVDLGAFAGADAFFSPTVASNDAARGPCGAPFYYYY